MSLQSLLSSYAKSKDTPTSQRITKQERAYEHPLKRSLESIYHAGKNEGNGERVAQSQQQYEHSKTMQSSSTAEGCDVGGNTSGNKPIKLVMLVIIVQDFPHEALWRWWIDRSRSHKEDITFLFHAKFPDKVKSKWVRKRLAKSFHLKPSWGSVELTDVMIQLLREGLQQHSASSSFGHGTHFCYASESCIPIVPLDAFFDTIQASAAQSWIDYKYDPTDGYSKQLQFDPLACAVPAECICKSDQWILLERGHAERVLALQGQLQRPLLSVFKQVRASDEMYFSCCMAILGYIRRPQEGGEADIMGAVKRAVTYADWSQRGKSPESYLTLSLELIDKALAKGCIFMRKLKNPIESPKYREGPQRKAELYEESSADQHTQNKHVLARLALLEHWVEALYPTQSAAHAPTGNAERSSGDQVEKSPQDASSEGSRLDQHALQYVKESLNLVESESDNGDDDDDGVAGRGARASATAEPAVAASGSKHSLGSAYGNDDQRDIHDHRSTRDSRNGRREDHRGRRESNWDRQDGRRGNLHGDRRYNHTDRHNDRHDNGNHYRSRDYDSNRRHRERER